VNNEQINIKEYEQSLQLLEAIRKRVEDGEVLSLIVMCEMANGDMQGGTTATQNQFAVAGYMLAWALRRLGFTQFDDVRMMLKGLQ
jgi:hypothetical protein